MPGILVFGATSMVGSHFVGHLPDGMSIAAAGRTRPSVELTSLRRFDRVDLQDPREVEGVVRRAPEDIVVNFAARTDVDGVERERPAVGSGPTSPSPAHLVNALAPEAMARAARDSGKWFITISTDFVFTGERGPYDEDSLPAPLSPEVSWYGWTKGDGERRVRAVLPEAAIVRIAYPYRPRQAGKTDFAGWVVARHAARDLPPLYTDQQITPTWIPDVTAALLHLIPARRGGTYHVASPTVTTPFEFARGLLRATGEPSPTLAEGSLSARLKEPHVTPRPLWGGLKVEKVTRLGFIPTSWQEGVKQWAGSGVPA